jgi:hypothetical protein
VTVQEFAAAFARELEKEAERHEDEGRRWRNVRQISDSDFHRARAIRDVITALRKAVA